MEADVTAAKPPRLMNRFQIPQFVPVRAMSTWYLTTTRRGEQYSYGLLLQGGYLYRHSTVASKRLTTTKLGGGWTSFKVIVGIDHNTDSGYQYAFSKANGTATAITSYGKSRSSSTAESTRPAPHSG
jgi:hypothetical protein